MSEATKTISLTTLLPHSSLSRKIWDNEELSKEVSSALLAIAKKFYESLGVTADISDIVITGSMANFNYTDLSDIDLHIILNFSKIDENVELVREFMLAKKALWNDRHEITIKGHEVEVYVENEGEPHYSTGIFSVKNDKWIKQPTQIYGKLDIDLKKIKDKSSSIMQKINRALRKKDIDMLNSIKDKIVNMRKTGLERGGAYSVENLVFKTIRMAGYLDKISKSKTKIFDKSLSIEQ
tara:strand:- start:168 stop:881 length:714 start_codon:yes stop_codon:yes gene_type:complete